MRHILVISDTHDNIDAFSALVATVDFDLLVLPGDICEFRCNEFYNVLRNIETPIIFTPGNHDCVYFFEQLSTRLDNFFLIDNDVIQVETDEELIIVAGLGGVLSKRRRDIHHFTATDISILANKLLRYGKNVDILITHECARNCSDIIPNTKGARGGTHTLYLLHLIAQPKIHICGHMHYPCTERFRITLCVNAGYGFGGLGAIIDYKALKVKHFYVETKQNLRNEHKIIYGYNWIRNVKRSYYRILKMEAKRVFGSELKESF